MKIVTYFFKAVLCLSVIASITACSKDDDPVDNDGELKVADFTTSRKTDYGDDWIYFSFKDGKEVQVDEASHQSNATWDIAFNRYNIRTNSGKSGNGKGGAYDAGKVDFNSVTAAPATGYTTDADYEISDVGSGFPPPTKMSTANTVLCEAITFSGPPPAYTPSEHVYVVKTADGKYVKVLFKNFYNEKGESGFVSFRYAYQPDGSTNLK